MTDAIRQALRGPLKVGMMAFLLALPTAGQSQMPSTDAIPDHVCLPSVSEEDAAWAQLQQEEAVAAIWFGTVDKAARTKFDAEEKILVKGLIEHKKELDSRYAAAYKLTSRLNPVRYPCEKPELHSQALVAACHELAVAAELVREAEKGTCRALISTYTTEISVEDGSPCAPAAKRYRDATRDARAKYQEQIRVAEASYRQKMMPACSLWQRITFKELDRPALRARQECVAALLSPTNVSKCTTAFLKGR